MMSVVDRAERAQLDQVIGRHAEQRLGPARRDPRRHLVEERQHRVRRPPSADHLSDVLAGRPVRVPAVARPQADRQRDHLEAVRSAGLVERPLDIARTGVGQHDAIGYAPS
jgi:hypothetical protein